MHNRLLLSIAAALIATAAVARADDDPPQEAGRLSYIGGNVSVHTQEGADWEPAELNYPVTSGLALWTDAGGRGEVQIGASELRMDQATQVQVNRLDYDATQITVPQGVVNLHLHRALVQPIQVFTPLGEVDLTQPGSYRINAGAPDTSGAVAQVGVAALEGVAQVKGTNSQVEVNAGEEALLTANGFMMQEASATGFDDWALTREHREENRQALQYASPEMTGLQDLDAYGTWNQAPQYGAVWYPAVAADWAPYRDGHWAYVRPWGWTWVDNAPWGFAPFHYGRWAQVGGRWGWCPGEVVQRPVYAPALVAFIGGSGFHLSISAGSGPAVGWVPLAPHEVFHPYYRSSANYMRHVNVTNVDAREINVTNVNVMVNRFANARAATAVNSQTFARGGAVRRSFHALPADAIAHAQVVNDVSHVTPEPHEHPRAASRPPERVAHVNIPSSASQRQEPEAHNWPQRNPEPSRIEVQRPGAPPESHDWPERKLQPETHPVPPQHQEAPHIDRPQPPMQPETPHAEAPRAPRPAEMPHVAEPRVAEPEHPVLPSRPEVPRAEPQHSEVQHEEHQHEERPHEEARHPEQHGQMTPTAQGWQRVKPPAAPHEPPHPQSHPDDHPDRDRHQ